MRLLFVMAWLPLALVALMLAMPFIGAVAHLIFYMEHLHSFYGEWVVHGFQLALLVLIVFSLHYKKVLFYGLIPLVAYCWWMTS